MLIRCWFAFEIKDPATTLAGDDRLASADVGENLRANRHPAGHTLIVARFGQREPAAHPRKALIRRAGLRTQSLHPRVALDFQSVEFPLALVRRCGPFFQLSVNLDASRFHLGS